MPTHDPQDLSPRSLFRPPIVSSEFLAAFDGVEKVLRERFAAELSALTREQFIEAMAQAVACGDFQRHVTAGEGTVKDGIYSYSHRQAITYEPYRECEHLRARIRELEADLECANDTALDSAVTCGH